MVTREKRESERDREKGRNKIVGDKRNQIGYRAYIAIRWWRTRVNTVY